MDELEIARIQTETAMMREIDVLRTALHQIANSSIDTLVIEIAVDALRMSDVIMLEDVERKTNRQEAN